MRAIILSILLFTLLFSSCTIQKRHYRAGYYTVFKKGAAAANFKKIVEPAMTTKKIDLPILFKEGSALVLQKKSIPIPKKAACFIQKKGVLAQLQNKVHRNFPSLSPIKKNAFYTGVIPNHVAQAAFKMMLIGLVFLGLAGFFLLQFPELAYVTVTLLIITTIFAAVAAFTALNARQDKINNSETWLKLSLLSLLLSLLIICTVVLFLILLF